MHTRPETTWGGIFETSRHFFLGGQCFLSTGCFKLLKGSDRQACLDAWMHVAVSGSSQQMMSTENGCCYTGAAFRFLRAHVFQ